MLRIIALTIALYLSPAFAHEFPCAHDHATDDAGRILLSNICTDGPSTCSGGCTQIITRDQTYCSCDQGDCETAFAAVFTALSDEPLAPNTTRQYELTTRTLQSLSVLVEDMEVASFGPTPDDTFGPADADALFGQLTLAFGSFADSAAIPVTASRLNIDLISLAGEDKESGPNIIGLRDGQPIHLVYDAHQNSFALADADEIGIALHLANDLAGDQPATLYFDGKFDAEGHLAIFGQLAVGDVATAIRRLSWGRIRAALAPVVPTAP